MRNSVLIAGLVLGLLQILSAPASWIAPAVHQIRISLSPANAERLRLNPRAYVPARLELDEVTLPVVGFHLKGSGGSFRALDDQPAMTLGFNRFLPDQQWLGTTQVHLNNSVEDPSYLNEFIGGEVFRAAGIPAPRTAHALVSLNGRRLGLYVLQEGFTPEFLAREFHRAGGIICEPAPGPDVDGRMRARPHARALEAERRLAALAAAAHEPDLEKRWQGLADQLDVDRFVTFLIVEVMLGHRDGYSLAKNNFRIALDPRSGRAVFLPHGMDQLFQSADLPWNPRMAGLVADAVLDTPEGRLRYEERFRALLPVVLDAASLARRVDDLTALICPALTFAEAAKVRRSTEDLKAGISGRLAGLQRQLAEARPAALPDFSGGSYHPSDWAAMDTPAGGRMDIILLGETEALRITAGPVTAASWQTLVQLPLGRYQLNGRVRIQGVKPLPFGQNQGATLRVRGAPPGASAVVGESGWQSLRTEFSVATAGEPVRLICGLRASAGAAWFDRSSLTLTRLE